MKRKLDTLREMTVVIAGRGPRRRQLGPHEAVADIAPVKERAFRWDMNEDAMATKNMVNGIRNFHADSIQQEHLIQTRMES